VVEAGLTLAVPVSDVEVKFSGAMAMLVAPVTAQLSVVLAPEVIVVGLAVKEVTTGSEPGPDGEPLGIVEPQPVKAKQIRGISAAAAQRPAARRIKPD
jgi:hypothetical protein